MNIEFKSYIENPAAPQYEVHKPLGEFLQGLEGITLNQDGKNPNLLQIARGPSANAEIASALEQALKDSGKFMPDGGSGEYIYLGSDMLVRGAILEIARKNEAVQEVINKNEIRERSVINAHDAEIVSVEAAANLARSVDHVAADKIRRDLAA